MSTLGTYVHVHIMIRYNTCTGGQKTFVEVFKTNFPKGLIVSDRIDTSPEVCYRSHFIA